MSLIQLFTLVILLSSATRVYSNPTQKLTSTSTPRLGMAIQDDISVQMQPLLESAETGKIYRHTIVKILRTSPDGKMHEIESEYTKGWVDTKLINLNFDRKLALKTYETTTDMSWFFDRFNQGTNYESNNFESERFTVEEYRSLIKASIEGKIRQQEGYYDEHNEKEISQIVLARTLFADLKIRTQTSEVAYFTNFYRSKSYWEKIHSVRREFWEKVPSDFLNDAKFVETIVTNGAYVIYDHLPEKFRDSDTIAKLTFGQNPEAYSVASTRIKDNEELTLIAVLQNPLMVENASTRLRDNEDLFLRIAPVNAMSLQHASDRLKNKPDFVARVCEFRPWALQYSSDKVRDNSTVLISIAKQTPMVIKLASERIKNDTDTLRKMYEASPEHYKKMFYDSLSSSLRYQIISPQ